MGSTHCFVNTVGQFLIKMSSFRICGPKMAMFGTCLSVWGIIQLSIMALAFYQNSVAFVEDLPESAFTNANCTKVGNKKCNYRETVGIMEKAYGEQAQNCGVAVALYILTLIVSLHQLWMNSDRDTVVKLNTNLQRGRNAYVRHFDNVPMDT